MASTGYVRSKLTVFQGGGARTAAPTTSLAGNAAIDVIGARRSPRWCHDGRRGERGARRSSDARLEQIRTARLKGYEGDSCVECGNFTLVRNGTCLKCDTCGGTSGCS